MPRTKQARNVAKARTLRASMAIPEVLFWHELWPSADAKFCRKQLLGPYVLDFYSAAAKLCVEIDSIALEMGERLERDVARDDCLRVQGIEVIRIPAADFLKSLTDTAKY